MIRDPRSIPAAGCALGMWVLVVFSSATANADSPSPWIRLEFDGNVAVGLEVRVEHETRVQMWVNRSWVLEEDMDGAALLTWYRQESPSLRHWSLTVGSASGPGEALVMRDGERTRLDPTPPWAPPWERSDPVDVVFSPGVWWIASITGNSAGIRSTSVDLHVSAPEASLRWEITHQTGLITTRDFDRGSTASIRSVGIGASVAMNASVSRNFQDGLTGFLWYVPTAAGMDDHTVSVSGRGGTANRDYEEFVGWAPGTYHVSLEQRSAGLWPGRLWMLYGDLGLHTSGCCP